MRRSKRQRVWAQNLIRFFYATNFGGDDAVIIVVGGVVLRRV